MAVVDETTRKRVDEWLRENDLNEYGDPKETMYMGGTPLFNEATGEMEDRYEFLLRKYPELRSPTPEA